MGTMTKYLPVVCKLVSSYNPSSYCRHIFVYVGKLSIFLLLIVMLLHAAGTPIVTTRGCLEGYFEVIAHQRNTDNGQCFERTWKSAERISKRLGEQ